MATKIPIGSAAYLTSFVDGQGAGAANYIAYATDFDINFLLLRQTVNQIIDEVSAVSGPNAIAALDTFLWDDADNPITTTNEGVVGSGSYEVSIEGGGTLKVKKGQVYVLGQRAELLSDLTGLTSSGGAGTRWVAVDNNGQVFIESAAAARALDIATVEWNGTIFVAPITQFAEIFFDGDGWAELRDRPASGTTFPATKFRKVSDRILDLELAISSGVGPGPLVSPAGLEATPGLIFEDGVGGQDAGTGWFRPGANLWAWAASTTEVVRLAAAGLLFNLDGTAGATVIRRSAGVGIFFPSSTSIGFAAASTEVLRISAGQLLAVDGLASAPAYGFASNPDAGVFLEAATTLSFVTAGIIRYSLVGGRQRGSGGSEGFPGYSFLNDTDTGMRRAGANILAFGTGGTDRVVLDAEGNVDLPTNMGAIVRRAAQQTAIVTATPTNVSWDTEDRDIGGWIAVTATDLTVPTGGDGLYLITFSVDWAIDVLGERQIHIEAAGVTLDPVRDEAGAVGDNKQSTTTIVALVVTDVVRGVVEHTVGVNHEVDSARLAIQKIA